MVVGALVLAAFALALVLGALRSSNGVAPPSGEATSGPSAAPSMTPGGGAVVDPKVAGRGWIPEPITQDRDIYVVAALEAAGTFDTTLATRSEWVEWLESWFTPSPLYENSEDALDQLARYKAELDQAVLLPQQLWDELASDDGHVTAAVRGTITYLDLPETTASNVWTASADVVMTYTRRDEGEEVSYDDTVRVSVQVVCGGDSVPAPDSAQRPGDCKVVRFFDEAVG